MYSGIEEWRADFTVERGTGAVSVALYGVAETGQLEFIDNAMFGPFETALDVTEWLVRHWAPRARLPLR